MLTATLALAIGVSVVAAPPNLMVILADDMGRGEYSGFGTRDVQTPHIDRLFREGMGFANFHANSCVCSPTRAALLTGCYPDRVGVPGVIRENSENSWGYLAPRATLLPAALKAAGYHSAIVGKWHLGLTAPNLPNLRGFDHFHGFLGDMMDDYWTHLRHGHNFMRRNEEVIEPKGHATDLFTDWACDYLQQRAAEQKPFFLYLAYNAPHDPIQPPPEWLARVERRGQCADPKRARLVALIEHLDDGIGRVLAALDRLKLAENTLVVFTSDNGGSLVFGANNGPWRDGKGHVYEGGLRVPAVARWPGHIQAGSTTDVQALSMDLFPTLLAAAGAAAPAGIDGHNLLPTLLGQTQPPRRGPVYYLRREGGVEFGGKTIEALFDGRWKLVCDNSYGPRQLFDLSADPYETRDLAATERATFARVDAQLRRQLQRGGQTPWQPPEGPP